MLQKPSAILLTIVLAWTSPGANAESPDEAFLAEAQAYGFERTPGGQPLTLKLPPLINWNNPARNGEDGSIFLWCDGNDQPAVIGTCFTYTYREQVRHKNAFHALTDYPIVGKHDSETFWTPPTDALEWTALQDVPPPGPSSPSRTVQLRGLARQFRVELTNKDGRGEQCRLLPKPLYRYDADAAAGAIFAFAIGTDPEALLLIDRRSGETGQPVWAFALARFNFYPLQAFREDKLVWSAPEVESLRADIRARPDYQKQPYITFPPLW